MRYIYLLTVVGLLSLTGISANDGSVVKEAPAVFKADQLLRVYLDCQTNCYSKYLQTELGFVEFVRFREIAQVHVIITARGNGSGGRTYNLQYLGLNEFDQRDEELTYGSEPDATEEDIRAGLLRVLRLGLAGYAMQTALSSEMDVVFRGSVAKKKRTEDPWDSWVFNVRASSNFSGEESNNNLGISGHLRANRVTEDWKLRLGYLQDYNEHHYNYKDEEPYTSYARQIRLWSISVKSLSDHWSAGLWVEGFHSIYDNIAVRKSIAPAIEYNIFPYSESERHELRIMYKLGYDNVSYIDTTIYNQLGESLMMHAINIDLEMVEPWGNVDISLRGSNYLHDFSKSKLSLSVQFDVRVTKGLAINFWGRYVALNNQLSLPKEDLSLEDLLLQQRAIATDYRYHGGIGLSYTFGSIFNYVVNPRM